MSEIHELTQTQESHLETVDALWAEYGPLLRRRGDFAGGVQWKTIGGKEYLYRYGPDPLTRQKRSTSMGRRSPETEAFYNDFLTQRDRIQARLAELGPEAETLARMSKAFRLGRVRESIVDLFGVIWVDGLVDDLTLSGLGAIPAYEHKSRATTGRLPDLQPIELFIGIDRDDEIIHHLQLTLGRVDKTYVYYSGRGAFIGDQGPEVVLTTPRLIEELLDEWGTDDSAVETVLECQLYDPLQTMIMAKSGNVAPVSAMDPRGWLAFTLCRAHYDSSLHLEEREALVEIAGRVGSLARTMGIEFSEDMAELPFLAPLFDDQGVATMKI